MQRLWRMMCMKSMNSKKQFKWFSVMDWQKEEEYLREMHKQGWKLVKVTGIGMYYFEQCQPEDMVYQLDYNQEGIAHKEEYVQVFQDCGWEYLFDFNGYSYFRKPVSQMQEEEQIFCDEQSRMDMIQRVFRGRILPLICLFLGVVLPQLLVQFNRTDMLGHILTGMFAFLFVLYVSIFIKMGLQYRKLVGNMKR